MIFCYYLLRKHTFPQCLNVYLNFQTQNWETVYTVSPHATTYLFLLLVMVVFKKLTESLSIHRLLAHYFPPVLIRTIYAIMEAWLSFHDVATVQNMYQYFYHMVAAFLFELVHLKTLTSGHTSSSPVLFCCCCTYDTSL